MASRIHLDLVLIPEQLDEYGEDHGFERIVTANKPFAGVLLGNFHQSLAEYLVSVLEYLGRPCPAVGNADYALSDTLETPSHGPDHSHTERDKTQD
jgi:hypothetical protein